MSRLATMRSWRKWTRLSPRFLPFADVATRELPLSRLFQLSLFQVSVGMCTALLIGTLNRVMIVELGVSAWLVAVMVALPLLFSPFRALLGFKSDTHKSVLGWRRVPYIWLGTLFQFSGLSIMPFALIVLSGDSHWPVWVATLATGIAFLLVGMGLHERFFLEMCRADHADGRTGACHRHCPAGVPSASGRHDVCHVSGGHGRQWINFWMVTDRVTSTQTH